MRGAEWLDKICQQNKESIKRSFIKTGIALPEDGSQDKEMNIEGVINYQIPARGRPGQPTIQHAEPI